MWVMTFHSACARILRAEAERLGYKRAFTIYDEADSLRMVKRCLRGARARPEAVPAARGQVADLRAPRTSSSTRATTASAPGILLRADGRRRLPAVRAADASRRTRWTSTTCSSAPSTCSSCSPTSATSTAAIFRWVLVDEYQDTNRAQYRLLQLLADEHRNLTVVGDDDQSIYSFRGADIRNILEFERDFPDADDRAARAELPLDADDPRRRQRADRPQPRAEAASTCGPTAARGEPIVIAELDDEHAEARYVASEIERLVEEGTSRDRIAVFYRVNAQSRVLEDTLVRFEVPYQVIGGTKFYDRAEIKDAIAYL